jgi:hypothetical protein
MKLNTFDRNLLLSTLLLIGSLCPTVVQAGWGSIHDSNRSPTPVSRPVVQHEQTQPEQRPQPPEPQREQPRQDNVTPRAEAPQPNRDQAHLDNNFHPAPQEVDRARADQAERQRLDIGEERRQASFWSDFHAGMRIDRLPDGFRRIGVRGHPYFYFQGVFYDNGPSGYVVIAPPVEASVTELPPGTETVVLGDTYYYYAGGAFYVQQADGTYIVVAPPIGVTVSTLPPDATPILINGMSCYQADGGCYEPVMVNGAVAYLTIPPP